MDGGPFRAADERRHADVGSVAPHAELWVFAATEASGAGATRLLVHLTWFAESDRVTFAAAVRTGPGRAIVVVAPDLATPRPGLELRGPGIWADHVVEEPFARWSLGLEAFGVEIDVDPAADLDVVLAAAGSPELRGDRTAVGWDLEWIASAAVEGETATAYRVAASVEGELLVGPDHVEELDLSGEWRHRW